MLQFWKKIPALPAFLLQALPQVLSSVLLLSSCGADSAGKLIREMGEDQPVDKNPVDTRGGTWGHLWGGRSAWLVQERPGRTIRICGDHASELVAGVKAWSRSAEREGELTIVGSDGEPCSQSQSRNIFVVGRNRPDAVKLCAKFPKAVALTYVDHSVVVVCDKTDKMAEVMLHEAGHLWGMCDVYPEDVIGGSNCDSRFFTGRSRSSVMGANYSNILASADIAGMTAMVRRDDVSGNRLWVNRGSRATLLVQSDSAEEAAQTFDGFVSPALSDSPITCVLNQ